MSQPRVRGHRIAGSVRARDFARHYGLETATIIAIAGAAASAAGTGVAYYGQQQQAESARKAGKYNQRLAENQALQAQYAGEAAARTQRERGRRLEGIQRSITAASGVAETGSPLLVMMDSAAQSELEAQKALYTGEVQADSARAQGAYARWQGNSGASGHELGAGLTLLQGFGNAAMGYAAPQRYRKGQGYGSARPQDLGDGLPY